MRSLVLMVLLAGCGRLAFDAVPVPDDAQDAAPSDGSLTDAGVGFDITTPSCPLTGFTFLGDASCMTGALELTADVADQVGAIWLTDPITIGPTTSFSVELTVQLTHDAGLGTTPGDGMAIVVQRDPRGTDAIGGTGGQLGYELMAPSSAVELDTYRGPDDSFDDEVGIDADGETVNELAVADARFVMSDGTPFTVWVDYSGETHEIAVSIAQGTTRPATPLLTQTDDLSRLGAAWFGLTAATAGSSEAHHVLRWKLAVTP